MGKRKYDGCAVVLFRAEVVLPYIVDSLTVIPLSTKARFFLENIRKNRRGVDKSRQREKQGGIRGWQTVPKKKKVLGKNCAFVLTTCKRLNGNDL